MKRTLTILIIVFLSFFEAKAQPNASISGTNATNCSVCNGSANAIVTGGVPPYTYNWSNGATTATITGLCPGLYSVTATDNVGNSSNTPSIIIGPWVIDSVQSTNTGCSANTGTGTVYAGNGTAPYTYAWSNGATSSNITGLSSGTYHITVTDFNGCSATDSIVITQPTIFITLDSSGNTQCGKKQGYISVTASGGTGPYTYSWSNGATTALITGLPIGTYSVTVTDANGCTGIYIVAIQGIPISISTFSTPTSCNNIGTVSVTVYNGIPPFTYNWSNGATTAYVSGLSAGNYSVTVTDSAGCQGTAQQGVGLWKLQVLGIASGYGQCVADSGKASPIFAGGVPPYTYQWSNGATTDTIKGLSAGTYKVVVRDKGGCKDSASVNIAASPTVTYVNSTQPDTGACNGTLEIVVSPNAKNPVTYTWYSTKDHKWEQSVTHNDTIKIDSLCTGWLYVSLDADSIPCTLLDSAYILGPNGIPNISVASPQVIVYPNPAKGFITVEMKSEKLKVNNDGIEIYNMLGEKVYSNSLNIEHSSFNISTLPSGQYMLRVYNRSFSKTVPFEVVK